MRDHSTKIRPQYPRNWPYLSGSAPAFPEGRCAGLHRATSSVAVGQTYDGEGGIRLRPRLSPIAERPDRSGKTQAAVPFECGDALAHKRLFRRLKSVVSGARNCP